MAREVQWPGNVHPVFHSPVLETAWRPEGQSLGLGYKWTLTCNALPSGEMLSFQADFTNASVLPTPLPTPEGIKGKSLPSHTVGIVQ